MFYAFTSTVEARSSSSLGLVLWDGENLQGCILIFVFGKYTNEKVAGRRCCLFLHFAPLSIILFPLVFRWFCPQLPPPRLSMVHPFATISPTFSSLVCKNPFVIHHPLFSSLPVPLIVPDTQSLHFYTPPSSFSPFNLPSCVFPILLSFPLFQSTHMFPLLLPFYVSLIYSPSQPFIFLLFLFSFHPPPKTHHPVITSLFNLPFLSLLSSSPLLLPLPLTYNHNSIPLLLNSAPTLTSPS